MYRLATKHFVTDGETDRRYYDTISRAH